MEALVEYLVRVSSNVVQTFTSDASFLSFWPMLIAGLFATLVVSLRLNRKPALTGRTVGRRLKTLRRALFPKWLITHQSSQTDLGIFLINHALIFFGVFAAFLTPFVFAESFAALVNSTGLMEMKKSAGWIERLVFTALLVLSWDFAATYGHYLKHRVPVFWEFHKVHHSATVMTPLTALRRHPMETVLSVILSGSVIGGFIAIWHIVMGSGVEIVTIFGAWSGIYIWRLLGYNLRHSHIWVSYGNFWNKILISPAQHQIHHSRNPKHHDTNFGHIFSIWDRLFGTLYLPEESERVKFGIDSEDADDFNSLKGIYLSPFTKSWALMTGKVKWRSSPASR